MACCDSYTECNELITIGYLKDFISTLIKDASGNTVTISTTSADTYCPTYDEIKALLPAHSVGTNGPLDDVDGIVLTGTGSSTVKQQELSIEYTQWKSFTVSANPTTIHQCGGSTNFSYVNTFTRYKKSMNNSCAITTTSNDVNDTQNSRVTFTTSSFGTISGHSMTVGENPHGTGGTAPQRSTVVTGHVTFRRSEKTNTVTITQNALSGSYKFWYENHGSEYDFALTCTSTIPYSGGTATATGSYKVDYWDVYKWWDDCNHDFSGKTENRNERTSSFTESAGSHVFSELECEESGETYTFTYHGVSCTTTQEDNPESCSAECECSSSLTLSTSSIEFDWYEGDVSWPPPAKYRIDIQSADCVTNIAFTQTKADLFEVGLSNSTLMVAPYRWNDAAGSEKTDTITITYNKGCSKKVEVKQKAFDCTDVDISKTCLESYPATLNSATTVDDDHTMYPDGRWINAAVVTLPSSAYIPPSALWVGYGSGFSEMKWNGNTLQLKLKDLDNGTWDYFEIGPNRYQFGCKEFAVYRACPCAMDDCYSQVRDGKTGQLVVIDHALPADPWNIYPDGLTSVTYNGVEYEIRYRNADALHVPYTALTVDGSQVAPSDFQTVSGHRILTNEGWYVNHYENGQIIRIGYDQETDQMCYYMPMNFTTNRVDYWVDYDVAPGNVMSGGEFDGQVPCAHFRVHLTQAPNGSHYKNSHIRTQYHEVMRYLTPLSTEGTASWPGQPNYNCGIIKLGGPNELNPNLPPPFIDKIPDGYAIDSNPDGSCPS